MISKVQNAELDLEMLLREEAVLKQDVAWFATNKNQRWSLHNFAAGSIIKLVNMERTWNAFPLAKRRIKDMSQMSESVYFNRTVVGLQSGRRSVPKKPALSEKTGCVTGY